MTQPDDSQINHHTGGGMSVTGKDGMLLYKAITLKSSLSAYAKHKMLMTRGLTPTRMLGLATEITQKSYKRGQYEAAVSDLSTWIETMKAAIPMTVDGEPV